MEIPISKPHLFDVAGKLVTRQALGVQQAGIREADTRPGSIAAKRFAAALYPGHPYGRLPTVESVEKITRDDLLAFVRRGDPRAEIVLKRDHQLKTVSRQPFPGPGLAVRILGEVTAERVTLLQQADLRVQEEISRLENYRDIWQSFAILLPVQTVGVMGDRRTYDNVVALRIVESTDGMTANWINLPDDVLRRLSGRICNEVAGVNRVVLDISSKPPSTIEWE